MKMPEVSPPRSNFLRLHDHVKPFMDAVNAIANRALDALHVPELTSKEGAQHEPGAKARLDVPHERRKV
jgi:hypothetical protein